MIGYQHVATNRACQVLWKNIQPGWYSDLAMLSQHAEYQHFAAFWRDLTICQVVWHISVDLSPGTGCRSKGMAVRGLVSGGGPTIVWRMSASEPFDGPSCRRKHPRGFRALAPGADRKAWPSAALWEGPKIVGRMSTSEPFDGSTGQGRRYENVL